MNQPLEIKNDVDTEGNPTGGNVRGLGISIDWQNRPRRADGNSEMAEPNGAFVEDAIVAARERLVFFQTATDGKFACRENEDAINALNEALEALEKRTLDRQARGVEGMNAV